MAQSYSETLGKSYQNGGAMAWIFFVAMIITYPLKMVLHHDFGYRAVGRNIIHNLVALGALGLFAFTIGGLIPISPVLLLMMTAFLGMSVYHHIQTNHSVQEGHIIISYISGMNSWLYPWFRIGWQKARARLPEKVRHFVHTPSEGTFQTWWEPAAILLLGAVVVNVDLMGGFYLIAGGVFLCLENRMGQLLAQDTLWNYLDGRTESAAITEAIAYMVSTNKDNGDDDDEPEGMRSNVFGRAIPAAIRNAKVGELLRQAQGQGAPSPWEVGVVGNHSNGVAQPAIAGS